MNRIVLFLIIVDSLLFLGYGISQVPALRSRFSWQIERGMAFARGIVDPVQPMPTAIGKVDDKLLSLPPTSTATHTPPAPTPALAGATATPIIADTPTPLPPTLTPTAIPEKIVLESPAYEKQDMNNCGPATLSMYLHYYPYGWEGDQFDISDAIKPLREDRNVNIEELVTYLRTQVGGLEAEYRVGGDMDVLRKLIAAGFPVMVEESMKLDEVAWLNDDRWAGHYLLLTGYDDASQVFFAQDSFRGPDKTVEYSTLDRNWKPFNRVYLIIYPSDSRAQIQSILGSHWDVDQNRQHAMEIAQQEIKQDSTDSYAWFNLGTNLVYFEKYQDAAKAYDTARDLGLPQRMLRYQFGPFFAYFHTGRNEDLIALADYALKRTPNAEEAILWKGWALYRQGKKAEAQELFLKALEAHPGYPDAQYGLNFVQSN